MDVLFKQFLDKKSDPKMKIHIIRMIFGGQTDQYDFHYFGWNFELLNGILKNIGFKNVEKVEKFSLFKDTSDYAPYGFPISLNVIAYKE